MAPPDASGALGVLFNHLELEAVSRYRCNLVFVLLLFAPEYKYSAGSQKAWGTANNFNLNKELKSLKDRIHVEARE